MNDLRSTDDEAFIRAILDAPGDKAPRLVYADWLDERDDPRGAFLRAELAHRGDTERLHGQAVGLDPVWVARVSRPPVGACVEHVRFEKTRPPITRDALAAIERRFALTLPADYQAFLLNYNAAWSDSAFFRSPNGYLNPLLYVFTVNDPAGAPYDGPGDDFGTAWQIQQLDLPWRLQKIALGTSWPLWDHPGLRDYIPILCDAEEADGESGWLCLGVRGDAIGQVAIPLVGLADDGDRPAVRPIASSFAAFLASLIRPEDGDRFRRVRRRLFEP
jgi:uncharacterized protein (TIGR02996 family)